MRADVFAPGRWRLGLDGVDDRRRRAGAWARARMRLVFGRELVDEPQRLVLTRGPIRVDVTGDGSGRYQATVRCHVLPSGNPARRAGPASR